MNILIVGGLGYIGSIITDMLSSTHKVDVLDCAFWGNGEVASLVKYDNLKMDNVVNVSPNYFKNYDKIIWACDIDVEYFYTDDNFKDYIERYHGKFEEVDGENDVLFLGSYQSQYGQEEDFVSYKLHMESMEPKECILLGALYGPSPRMRWDTPVNRIYYEFLNRELIQLQGNYLDKFPTVHVLEAAKFIAEGIALKSDDNCLDLDDVILNTSMYNNLELAFLIKNMLNADKVRVEAVGVPERIISQEIFEKELTTPKIPLYSAIDAMVKGLEKGQLPDFRNDKYSNEIMIFNMSIGLNAIQNMRLNNGNRSRDESG